MAALPAWVPKTATWVDNKTKIMAANVLQWQDWFGMLRDRIEEVAGWFSSRSITAGSGLTGGGTLAASRTLAIDWGTASTQVVPGDQTARVAAADVLAAGQLIVGNGTHLIKQLSAGTNGQTLTIASGVPSWVTPVTGNVPSVTTKGNIVASGADGPWQAVAAPTSGQSLIGDPAAAQGVAWKGTDWAALNPYIPLGNANSPRWRSDGLWLYFDGLMSLAKTVTGGAEWFKLPITIPKAQRRIVFGFDPSNSTNLHHAYLNIATTGSVTVVSHTFPSSAYSYGECILGSVSPIALL